MKIFILRNYNIGLKNNSCCNIFNGIDIDLDNISFYDNIINVLPTLQPEAFQ